MFAIISLKPKYAEAIFTGEKRCEFRKVRFSREVQYLIVYATCPIGKLVGWISIEGITMGSPDEIWEQTSEDAGISHEEFLEYYNGSTRAICIQIQDAHRFLHPIDPRAEQVDFVIPQSYRYLTEDDRRILPKNLKVHSIRIRADSDKRRSSTPFIKHTR